MQSVSSNAVYKAINEKYPITIGDMTNGTGNTLYWKILNARPTTTGYNVLYTIQSRAGELIILNIGDNDGTPVCKARRLLNSYSKVAGLRYKGNTLYVALASYSNRTTVTKLCGNYTPIPTIQTATDTEYSSGTGIAIDT